MIIVQLCGVEMTTADLFSSGHLTEEGIGLYVDGLKLGRMSELPAEILEHVAECGKCRMEIVELHQVLEEVSYAEGSAHPYFDRVPAKSPEQSRIPYAVAAILVLAIGVTYIVSTFSTREEQGGQVETSGKTAMTRPDTTHTRKPALVKEQPAKKQPRDKVLASNFEPSPNLEDLVGSAVRSSSIEVMSPSAGETV